MRKIITKSLSIVIVILSLTGCNSENDLHDQSIDSVNNVSTVKNSVNSEKTYETNEEDFSIPTEFVDYRKFIGKDISTLDVDTSSWNSYDYSHDLWKGSFYGIDGEISVRLGWDDSTIIEFFLVLDEEYKISDNEREKMNEEVIEIFGSDIEETQIAYEYSGKGDFELTIPKPLKQESVCIVTWNDDLLYNYMTSKPKTESSEAEENSEDSENCIPQREYIEPKIDPQIGMTAEEVRQSTWGEPDDINKTTTKYGVSEQWVYGGGKYIYLDDGVVTAIQE